MIKVLELFAGIGACSKALTRLGIEHKIVDAVEIDKYAIASFNAIHGTNFEPQDITEWNKDIDVDLIMHGSPCQDFSVAGKQAGGDIGSGTRSSLMYETIRIVGKLRPKYVIWENVKNLLSKKHKHNFDAYIETMNILGYNSYYQVLNAKDYGIPQNRERVFTISIRKDLDKGFEFPPKKELKLRLKDILENEVDEKYYLSDIQIKRIKTTNYNVGKTRIQEKEYCDTLCARDWKDPKCVRVGKQVSQTIQCNDSIGVVINDRT
jgi:DNA (cytosine-5)-methyltransferase 1